MLHVQKVKLIKFKLKLFDMHPRILPYAKSGMPLRKSKHAKDPKGFLLGNFKNLFHCNIIYKQKVRSINNVIWNETNIACMVHVSHV